MRDAETVRHSCTGPQESIPEDQTGAIATSSSSSVRDASASVCCCSVRL